MNINQIIEQHALWLDTDGKEGSRANLTHANLTYTVTIPEPMREAPETGSRYWLAETASDAFTARVDWEGDSCDHSWLKRGLCFATKEDAIAAAKAMLPFKTEGV